MKHRQFMRQMRTDVAHVGSLRYLNELVRLRCTNDLLALRLFPDMKEITESFGAYSAVRDHLDHRLSDPSITVLVVGDGHTPRTGATFAFRSAWSCYSVDPRLTLKPDHLRIDRLESRPCLIEDMPVLVADGPVIVVAVHSHASLGVTVRKVCANRIDVVAIPCCVPQVLDQAPTEVYDDSGIWSPKREVRIWTEVAA